MSPDLANRSSRSRHSAASSPVTPRAIVHPPVSLSPTPAYRRRQGWFRWALTQGRHLREVGCSPDELHSAAMTNLLTLMEDRTSMTPHGSIFGMFLDGNFEASLMLVDAIWDEALAPYAPGGIIIAVPARDVLAFGDASSPEAISELRELSARVSENGDHLITRSLFLRTKGQWIEQA